ncbi:MAG: hypothetical protein R2701_07150 [Acidimicrobiales bacterium]
MTTFPSTDAATPIVVIEADPSVRSRLAMQLGERAVPLESIEGVEERYTQPFLLVLGPSCSLVPGVTGAEGLLALARRPGRRRHLIAEDLSTEVFQRAMRSGVRRARRARSTRVSSTRRCAAPARASRRWPQRRPPGLRRPPFGRRRHGCTRTGHHRVLHQGRRKVGPGRQPRRDPRPAVRRTGRAVDADLQFGDIAVMLKLAPQHTIVDAVGSFERLDQGFGEPAATHQPSGLKVLPAPLEPAFADQIGAEQMNRIINLLRSFCSFVVVDTPAYFNDVVLGLIEESDDVLLVAGMDISNIKNVKIGLQTLRLLNTPMNKIHLILNRANSKVKLEVGEVERTLQVKADALIPPTWWSPSR